MPSENRVRGDDGGDLIQPSTPQAVPTHGEPPPFSRRSMPIVTHLPYVHEWIERENTERGSWA